MILKHFGIGRALPSFLSQRHYFLTISCLLLLYGRVDSGTENSGSSHPNSIRTDDKANNLVDYDIVDYGEDCSPEGPFCNEALHLICDKEEETCMCDEGKGFVHIDKAEDYRYLEGGQQVCVPNKGVVEPGVVYGERDKQIDKKIMRSKEEESEIIWGKTDPSIDKKQSKWKEVKEKDDPDIVGFGEDCSDEGPFCDTFLHLVCDPSEETCVCDKLAGYMPIDEVPGGHQHHWTDSDPKNVCVSQKEISDKAEELLGIKIKKEDNNKMLPSLAKRAAQLDMHLTDYSVFNEESIAQAEEDIPPEGQNKLAGIYHDLMTSLENDDQDDKEKRLEPFKLNREYYDVGPYADKFKSVVIEELMKYGKGLWDGDNMKGFIVELFIINSDWIENRLFSQVCGMTFDIDQDEVTSQQEYVISLLSAKVRRMAMPKAFYKIIRNFFEEDCIRVVDFRALDHDPTTFQEDFEKFDTNGDGCINYLEFESAMENVCQIGWFDELLEVTGLSANVKQFDPSPEEIYIRRTLQLERLRANFGVIDKNRDGFISWDELHLDLIQSFNSPPEESSAETDSLLDNMDLNGDKKISIVDIVSKISLPFLSAPYQYDWLESLYELYETDDEEVQERLATFLEADDELLANSSPSPSPSPSSSPKPTIHPKPSTDLRTFTIFDKNRDAEMDEVEFKLLLEIIRKYVVHGLLNHTLASIDAKEDGKLSVFDFQAFFLSASSNLQLFLKNLLSIVLGNEEGEEFVTREDEEYEEGDYIDNGDGTVTVTKILKNQTILVAGLFMRLDLNKDGFLTKDDLYYHVSSYQLRQSDHELKKEFTALDTDKDGVLTAKDSKEYKTPVDFEMYKEHAYLSEEVIISDKDNRFVAMDGNKDGLIQMEEYKRGKGLLIQWEEEEEFLTWVEWYFALRSPQMDVNGEKAFREFDVNCDGLITQEEFSKKLHSLQEQSKDPAYIKFLGWGFTEHFKRLDLNKDGDVSYNEFQFLLLRSNKRIHEK